MKERLFDVDHFGVMEKCLHVANERKTNKSKRTIVAMKTMKLLQYGWTEEEM